MTRLCKHPGCGRPHHARGYCAGHSYRIKHGQSLEPPLDVGKSRTRYFQLKELQLTPEEIAKRRSQ